MAEKAKKGPLNAVVAYTSASGNGFEVVVLAHIRRKISTGNFRRRRSVSTKSGIRGKFSRITVHINSEMHTMAVLERKYLQKTEYVPVSRLSVSSGRGRRPDAISLENSCSFVTASATTGSSICSALSEVVVLGCGTAGVGKLATLMWDTRPSVSTLKNWSQIS